jgi:hypothetical protein
MVAWFMKLLLSVKHPSTHLAAKTQDSTPLS